ncbi:hypothetical protein So717_43170 [Roseobacter cerasinus]|uniref:DUF7678 domain-containing protein n=1 Tax=Roseobacter cerasinus TaxID=2602289 RepID=A0A640VY99_9RHOB|nr:hypothetical protein [Roseobacter cerasinus]GFE52564.1 hypothetical protein So717_43170 [Roseobacter cerasinus]
MSSYVMEGRGDNYPFDTDKVELDGNYEDSIWVSGRLKGFEDEEITFEAKVFDIGSKYGIDDGRISKLHVYTNGNREQPLFEYSRGWDENLKCESLEPTQGREKLVLDTIVAAFPEPDNHLELKGANGGAPYAPDHIEQLMQEMEEDRLALDGPHEPAQPEPEDLGEDSSQVSGDEPESSVSEPSL